MKKDAVLFDLDGTLWDSSREVLLCWNRVLTPRGKEITMSELTRLMGLTPLEIGDSLFSDLTPTERRSLIDRCLDAQAPYLYEHGARLYPHVRETLRQLKQRYFIGLVSNCTEPYAQSFFHAHGLASLFDDHETAGRTGLDKGRNIALLLQRNRIERAVYVGDTAKDLAAAQAAAIPFVYADWGFGNLADVQYTARNFPGLNTIVSSILKGGVPGISAF